MSWYRNKWTEEEIKLSQSLLKNNMYLYKDALQQAYIVYDEPHDENGLTAYTKANELAFSHSLEAIKDKLL